MLLEHASTQQLAQRDSQLFALCQGDQLILFARIEHRIESPRRFGQKIFPRLLVADFEFIHTRSNLPNWYR